MLNIVIFRARHVMIIMGLMGTFLGNAGASPNSLTVQDARPVAKAIQELEKRYGWRITYEDPPYSHSSDMPDVTPSVQEGSSVAPGTSYLTVPKAAILSFPLPATNQDELSTVNAVVKIYNESHRGFVFAVVRGPGLLHVVPQKVTGLSGNLEPVKPVLDTVITIEPKERTADALIEEICKKISISTNTHVVVWHCPNKYVSPDEDFHRRIGKDGADYFRTIDCGDWRPVVVVMAVILRPR
jgi:hypothetical protein